MTNRRDFLRNCLGFAALVAVAPAVPVLERLSARPEIWMQLLDTSGRVMGAEIIPLNGLSSFTFTVRALESFTAKGIRYRITGLDDGSWEMGLLAEHYADWREKDYATCKAMCYDDTIETTLDIGLVDDA